MNVISVKTMQKEVVFDNNSEETSIIEEEEKNKSKDESNNESKKTEEDETIQEEQDDEEEDDNDEEDDDIVYQSDYESESAESDDDIIEDEQNENKSVDQVSDEIENAEKVECDKTNKNSPNKKNKSDRTDEKPGESSTAKSSTVEIKTEISPIESNTPTEMHLIRNIDFNIGQYDFNFDSRRLNITNRQPQQNLSFSNERIREIDRHNKILLQKILKKNPINETMRSTDHQTNQCKRYSSSAINRRKKQKQIELDNQLLSKKLSSIALRKPTNS